MTSQKSNSKINKINLPCKSGIFLKTYSYLLARLEKKEIKDYDTVYFVGHGIKHKRMKYDLQQNNNFTDGQGYYTYIINNHLAFRYELVKLLGEGSFGRVFEAHDHKTNSVVAVKNVRKIPNKSTKVLLREALILNILKSKNMCEFVVEMKSYMLFRGHIFITLELCYRDIFSLMLEDTNFKHKNDVIWSYAHSMFHAISAIQECGIIHGDIKPENLFVMNSLVPHLKLGDFGCSCFFAEMETHRIAPTLPYTPPELILGGKSSIMVDVWSAACVLAEMLLGFPIFAGDDYYDLITLMIQLMGVPPLSFLSTCSQHRVEEFFRKDRTPTYCTKYKTLSGHTLLVPKRSIKGKKRYLPGQVSLDDLCQSRDPLAIDFLKKCFVWNISKRMSLKDALKHPYLNR